MIYICYTFWGHVPRSFVISILIIIFTFYLLMRFQ